MTLPVAVRISAPITFPAQVNPGPGLSVAKANGIYTVSLNYAGLGQLGAAGINDPGLKAVAIFDTVTGVYNFMTLAGFGDVLFKLTSTTSLTIGAGSFVFATQPNKSVSVGSWVTATSNANVANYLNGQVTAYDALGNLTISVPTSGVGGSGTKADWTIRPSSIPPAVATVGAQAGANYTYVLGDQTVIKKRSNAGASMVDTLPGTAPGVLATGWLTRVVNTDSAGILAIGVGTGSTLDGNGPGFYIYLGPGQGATIVSDGAGYFAIEKPSRCRLGAASTTIFYGGAGSLDSNSGLGTGADAFANGQTAINFARDRIDGNAKQIIFKAADGTYTQPLQLFDLVGFDNGAWNPPTVVLRGNVATLGNVALNVTGGTANCITTVNAHTSWFVEGFAFSTSAGANSHVVSDYGSTVYLGTNKFGACVAHQIQAVNAGSRVEIVANYTINGSAGGAHWTSSYGGEIISGTITLTLTGTPAFTGGFATGIAGGNFLVSGATFSGSATGPKFAFDYTVGCSVNPATFPGSTAGTITPLPVASGGTGAVTAASARTNLGVSARATDGTNANVTLTAAALPFVQNTVPLTAARTWTLPAAGAVQAGDKLTISDAGGIAGANTITVQRGGADAFSGVGVAANAITLPAAFSTITVISDGSAGWYLVGKT